MAFYIVPYFRKKRKSPFFKIRHLQSKARCCTRSNFPYRKETMEDTPASTSLLSQDGFVFPLIPASTYNID